VLIIKALSINIKINWLLAAIQALLEKRFVYARKVESLEFFRVFRLRDETDQHDNGKRLDLVCINFSRGYYVTFSACFHDHCHCCRPLSGQRFTGAQR
jgi:hypothetical protein